MNKWAPILVTLQAKYGTRLLRKGTVSGLWTLLLDLCLTETNSRQRSRIICCLSGVYSPSVSTVSNHRLSSHIEPLIHQSLHWETRRETGMASARGESQRRVSSATMAAAPNHFNLIYIQSHSFLRFFAFLHFNGQQTLFAPFFPFGGITYVCA